MFLLHPFCRNFTVFLDKEYGNCFQFNGFDGHRKAPLKAREAGVVHGTSSVRKLFTHGANVDVVCMYVCMYVCIWFSDSVNLDNNAEAW